jgi:pimeloyl-ACP methyl ester carboxylesterase
LREFFRGQWPFFFAGPEKHLDILERMVFSFEPFEAAFRRELPLYDLRSHVRDLTMPVLLIAGSNDPYRADMEWLAGQLQESQLVLMTGCGHMPFLEEPGEFCQIVDEFLRG